MVFHLQYINEETIHEHILERYIDLGSHSDDLKQDLGTFNKNEHLLEIDIEPPAAVKKLKKRKNKPRQVPSDRYNFVIEQSITSLFSSRDNSNSTTGYVLWSTTPFFLKWLLYDKNAEPLRSGGDVEILNDPKRQCLNISPLLSKPNSGDSMCVLELGTGVSGMLPIVLSNYVDTFVCTDQKGILNKLKFNLQENLLQLNKRKCISKSLGLHDDELESTSPKVKLEIMLLDWENFKLKSSGILLDTLTTAKRIHIIAMDVIYNEYLINPFLNTLSQLMEYFQGHDMEVHALIGIQLRSECVLTEFLEKAIIEYELPVYHVSDSTLKCTRFSLYYL